ncbi:transcription factor 21 [Onthophagus taurus]|uniref:transcription factor 21 n=1 Tax=Onthophagus taurus TaxID=166361 RepID=UPI000C200AF3|nr:transcription factor 21 [Onthophagus taurus]
MPRKRRISDAIDSDDDLDDSKHPQRNAANARERARMRVLSKAFCRLKTTLPWVPADTKLSKLDTLRLATSYIAYLRAVLMDQPVNTDQVHKHPLALTWPFSFQRSDSPTIMQGNNVVTDRDTSNSWVSIGNESSMTGMQNTPLNPTREKDVSYYY